MKNEEKYHYIETKIYDHEGDLIKMSCSHVPGEYELTASDKRYLDWLDERKEKRVIIEQDV